MSTAVAEPPSVVPMQTQRPPTPGVYRCIAGVSAEMAKEGIAKDRSNPQQGYKFRGIDDVLNALAPMLPRHGLVILPRILHRDVVERPARSGGVLFSVTVEAEFDFVCAADGSTHTVKVFGEAMDSGDKATNKAMSAAYKYAAFQTFCIPTEGDNDADATTHEVQAPAAAAAIPPQGNRENAARPTAGDIGHPNTQTGEERHAPPYGYVYITDYRLTDNGWHDVKVGHTKYSTKQAVGKVAGEAFKAGRPVKIDSKPKDNAPGEHWLNNVTVWMPPLPEIQLRGDEHSHPVTEEEIPF